MVNGMSDHSCAIDQYLREWNPPSRMTSKKGYVIQNQYYVCYSPGKGKCQISLIHCNPFGVRKH